MAPVPFMSNASYQTWYDEQRAAISFSIDTGVEQLKRLQAANSKWRLDYPSSKATDTPVADLDEPNDNDDDDNTENNANHPVLQVTELSALRLDVKIGTSNDAELVQILGEAAVASVLEEKISASVRQLLTLRERISDPLSKILVTGDVNAGKSTFCNALLRRRILPENQQPCTAIFCEVLNARQNSGLEEIHAFGSLPNPDIFALEDLEEVVTDAQYTQCNVFTQLIDAPGLNHDTTHTTAVFARQEEIDVVVFVVSAANHFTISAKDFIRAATAEKEYLFIIVNAFDTIADKGRCKKAIMEQIRQLSPRTYDEASELVHFVSSNAVLTPSPGESTRLGSQLESTPSKRTRDFEYMERSLRKFVLENRAKSKLAPAKTFVLNILRDINTLSIFNAEKAQSNLDRASEVANDIVSQLESSKKTMNQVGLDMDRTIEGTCLEIFEDNCSNINNAIASVENGTGSYDVEYTGPWNAFQYAEDLKEAMLEAISSVVSKCEENARTHATRGVNSITQLGILHGKDMNAFEKLQFRPEAIFSLKRDVLAKQIDVQIGLRDFISWSPSAWTEKFASASMALTLATTASSYSMNTKGWVDSALMLARVVDHTSLRQVLFPGLLITVAAGLVAYTVQQIPYAVPRNLASKIATELSSTNFVYANSTRITERVRRVLSIPASSVRAALDRRVWDLGQRQAELDRVHEQSSVALKYFQTLERESNMEEKRVKTIDLESPPSALAE